MEELLEQKRKLVLDLNDCRHFLTVYKSLEPAEFENRVIGKDMACYKSKRDQLRTQIKVLNQRIKANDSAA